MAPSRNARKSLTIPPRLTLELITDIFQVMLENMGMTEGCIVEFMTSSKGFQLSQMVQLRQALKLAVDMGLVTLRDERYMFTMTNLENMIEHKQDRMEEGVDGSPASTLLGADQPSDRRSLAAVADYVASADNHAAALAASLGAIRRGAKRSASHCPTPLAKRTCLDAGVVVPRACRGHYKPFRTDVPTPAFPRSSTASVGSHASSGVDTHRGIRNPRQARRLTDTRRYVRKYVAQKRYSDKARPGRPSKRNSGEKRKRGRPLKKNSQHSRGRKAGRREGEGNTFDDPLPSTSAGRGGKKKTPSLVSTDDSYYAPKVKRRRSDEVKPATSKHSVVSTSTSKTASSRHTASTLGKAPSKTSRKSSNSAVADRTRRSGTTSLLKEYLESSFMKKTCDAARGSGSSVGSKDSGRLSKTSSKTSLNSVAVPPERDVEETRRGGNVGRPKTAAEASMRMSCAGASLLPKDSGSSVESRASSRASKASTKTTATDATPPDGDAPHNVGGRKRKQESGGARVIARTMKGARNTAGSSVASKSSNASKASSKTSFNTDDSTESVRNAGPNRSEKATSNPQKPQGKTVKQKVSATSTASKSSNVSKASSRTSCNTEDSVDSAHSAQKPEPKPTNQKSDVKSQISDSSIGSKGSNMSKASSKASCNSVETTESARSSSKNKPGDVTASQKSLRNKSESSLEAAQRSENRKSAAVVANATSKSSCKLEKPTTPDDDAPQPKTTRNSVKASSSESGGALQHASASSSAGAVTSFARTVKLPRAQQQQDRRGKPTSKSSCEAVDAGAATFSSRGARRAARCGRVATPKHDDDDDDDTRTLHDFYT